KKILYKYLDDYNKNNESAIINYSANTLAVLAILKDNVPKKMNGYAIKSKLNQLYYQVLDLKRKQLKDHESYINLSNNVNSVKNTTKKEIIKNKKAADEYGLPEPTRYSKEDISKVDLNNLTNSIINDYNCMDLNLIIDFFNIKKTKGNIILSELENN